ncbi:DUF2306 domain-containing protein [Niallia sp. Krafla_26]|uniref:DUF2306 domain-containing protein n=1 Tax=Niallia sp. Krafla_26 TaxID=3064703 RepID=UPI003D17C6D9
MIIISALLLGVASVARYFIFDPVIGNQLIIVQGLDMYKMEYQPWNYILYIHIITAAVALIVGPFQFLQNKRKSHPLAVHRFLGTVYIISIMISGLSGIYLSWFAFGGLLSKMGFLVLSISWLLTTYFAYSYIRKKKINLHREWMYRSYGITFVAVTFRIWSAVIGYSLDNFTIGYVAAIWLGLIGNILAVEIWIRRNRLLNDFQ